MADIHREYDTNRPTAGYQMGGGRRHMFITSKGVVWISQRHEGNIAFYAGYNGDTLPYRGGATSSPFNGQITCDSEYSLFCDEKDNVHIVYAKYQGSSSDGRTDKATIMYRHGLLNTDHTAITWGPEVAQPGGYDYWHAPDIVAHWHTDNTIKVHMAWNYNWAGDNRHITVYHRLSVPVDSTASATSEQYVFLHDVGGAQTFVGRVNIELRHNGSGKVPESVNGVRQPDLFFTWTSSAVQHYARVNWSSGNTWAVAVSSLVVDTAYGAVHSPSAYGGLYEHHRWARILYDPTQQRVIIMGFFANGSFSYQGVRLWEAPLTGSFSLLYDGGNWAASAGLGLLSADVTLDTNGDLFAVGSVGGAQWYSDVGSKKWLRPRNSTTRTLTDQETFHPGVGDTVGAHANLLQYPQSEHQVTYRVSANAPWYWRTSRGSLFTFHVAAGVSQRRARFVMVDGAWIPAQPKLL